MRRKRARAREHDRDGKRHAASHRMSDRDSADRCSFCEHPPLLEKECRSRLAACRFDPADPIFRHRSRARTTLAADNGPVDSRQISSGNRTQQRFERNKSDGSIDPAQIVNAREIVGIVPSQTFSSTGSDAVISAIRSGRFVRI